MVEGRSFCDLREGDRVEVEGVMYNRYRLFGLKCRKSNEVDGEGATEWIGLLFLGSYDKLEEASKSTY